MTDRALGILSPATLVGLVVITVVAYLVHTMSWILHEIQGGAWHPWLEMAYLAGFIVWVSGFVLLLVGRRVLRRTPAILGDERTSLLFLRAHQVSLIVVLCAQVPFFFFDVPARALAQLTVTTAVVALFSSYAWLDR